jgi:hypothetical protein
VVYGTGEYDLTKKKVGTRYVLTSVRTLVDPGNPDDREQVHALQDAIAVKQPGGPGRFDVPNWDPVSQKNVRDLLKALGESLPDWNGAAGPRRTHRSRNRTVRARLSGRDRRTLAIPRGTGVAHSRSLARDQVTRLLNHLALDVR